MAVGAPQLKRYTAFGHLFAGYQGQTYRIDRHPVMSRHPVTPMDEADLTLPDLRGTAWGSLVSTPGAALDGLCVPSIFQVGLSGSESRRAISLE